MNGMFQRITKGMRTTLTVAMLTVATYATAQTLRADHPDTYVVKKGDTLWDIAGRFLQRPWLWPEIWQANPQISNPHLIYPGDVISLAYLNRAAITSEPGPRTGEPINAIPLSDIEKYLKDLRVVDSIKELPYVVALEEDRKRVAEGNVVYARGLQNAQVGERFMVVRPMHRYTRLNRTQCCDLMHKDDLDFRGRRNPIDSENFWTNVVTPDKGNEFLGYELQTVNMGTVTRNEGNGIQVTTVLLDGLSSREVREGDRLIPVQAQPYDLQFFPHAPPEGIHYGRGRVLAVADADKFAGPRDVVAISLGSQDGIDNGTVFSLWREGTNKRDAIKGNAQKGGLETDGRVLSFEEKVRLPDEFSGHVMIFRTFDKMSYGLVMDSIKPTRAGYHVKHPDAPY